jgi:hypothetical protein
MFCLIEKIEWKIIWLCAVELNNEKKIKKKNKKKLKKISEERRLFENKVFFPLVWKRSTRNIAKKSNLKFIAQN